MSNNQLSKTERAILKAIIKNGTIRSDELYEQLNRIPCRAVTTAAASLRKKGLVRKISDLTDMRCFYYTLSEELASRLKARVVVSIPS